MFNINNNSSYADKIVLVVWDNPVILYSWHALEKVTKGLNELFTPIQFKKIDNFSELDYDDPEKYSNFILYLVTPFSRLLLDIDNDRFNMIKNEFRLFKRNSKVQPIVISLYKATATPRTGYGELLLTYTGMHGLDEKSHVNNTTRDLLFTILAKDDPSLLPHSYSYTIPIEPRKKPERKLDAGDFDDFDWSSYHYQDNIIDNDDVSF